MLPQCPVGEVWFTVGCLLSRGSLQRLFLVASLHQLIPACGVSLSRREPGHRPQPARMFGSLGRVSVESELPLLGESGE